jgi:ubiquitin-protein ligase
MIARPHEAMDIYVNESNMSFWKIIMSGPSASPYERGTFVLMVEMPSNYPQRAPTVRFITPILHPNVTKVRLSPNRECMTIWLTNHQHGRICHQILGDNWRPSFHIYDVVQNIYGLLMSPEVKHLARLNGVLLTKI